jgi:hypothetical protein
MLQFHITAKLAKTLRVKLEAPFDGAEVGDLNSWYVRDIPLDLPLDALLFTNAETLYTLVHPLDRRESADEIIELFRHRLEHITGQSFTPSPYRICKTASRRVLGCANEQALEIQYLAQAHAKGDGVRFEVIEDRLNNGIIGGAIPKDAFASLLETSCGPRFKPTKAPHLRVVK